MITKVIPIELTGGAGASGGTARFGISPCALRAFQIEYLTQPNTCNIVITSELNGLSKTVLTVAAANTNIPLAVLGELVIDDTGTPVAGVYVSPRLSGEIEITVDSGDDADPGVIISLLIEE